MQNEHYTNVYGDESDSYDAPRVSHDSWITFMQVYIYIYIHICIYIYMHLDASLCIHMHLQIDIIHMYIEIRVTRMTHLEFHWTHCNAYEYTYPDSHYAFVYRDESDSHDTPRVSWLTAMHMNIHIQIHIIHLCIETRVTRMTHLECHMPHCNAYEYACPNSHYAFVYRDESDSHDTPRVSWLTVHMNIHIQIHIIHLCRERRVTCMTHLECHMPHLDASLCMYIYMRMYMSLHVYIYIYIYICIHISKLISYICM